MYNQMMFDYSDRWFKWSPGILKVQVILI